MKRARLVFDKFKVNLNPSELIDTRYKVFFSSYEASAKVKNKFSSLPRQQYNEVKVNKRL
jgi:hypothetical protein